MGTSKQRYKLWWSGNDAGPGGVEILVKEEISGNVIKVRRKSNRVMAIVLTFEKEVMRMICAHGPRSGWPDTEKVCLYDKMVSKFDLGSSSEIIFPREMSMGMWGNVLRVLKVCIKGEWDQGERF